MPLRGRRLLLLAARIKELPLATVMGLGIVLEDRVYTSRLRPVIVTVPLGKIGVVNRSICVRVTLCPVPPAGGTGGTGETGQDPIFRPAARKLVAVALPRPPVAQRETLFGAEVLLLPVSVVTNRDDLSVPTIIGRRTL